MLLNYLYANFLEEKTFVETNCTSQQELNRLIAARVFPAPSYVYESKGWSISFVSDFTDNVTYRFHLRGHAAWFETIMRLDIMSEDHAHRHFFARYEEAKEAFLSSDLGRELVEVAPDILRQFGADHADMTWGHFLSGVYGVCTRDGQPESVFLKQAGVMFIERMIAGGPASLSNTQLTLLKRTVAFLNKVESDFAPHEAADTSRQRCIVDVNAKFFNDIAV